MKVLCKSQPCCVKTGTFDLGEQLFSQSGCPPVLIRQDFCDDDSLKFYNNEQVTLAIGYTIP